MNQNIISRTDCTRGQQTLGERESQATQKPRLDLSYAARHEQLEQRMFSDFKHKFFEANLDKVISWEELRSIALAMENRDWGYVKYILTIICLMLKSYQNISGHTPKALQTPQRSLESVEGVMHSIKQMDLSPPLGAKQVPVTKESVQEQLKSLSNIFKKMKNIEVQMNISNCWKCYSSFCLLHPLQSQVPLASAFKKVEPCADTSEKVCGHGRNA